MKIYDIHENDANQRLDKFLKKLFPLATRSLIYKINRKGKIKISSKIAENIFSKKDNEYKLQIWDKVKIFLSDDDFKTLSENITLEKNTKEVLNLKDKITKKDIVYEDADLLVLNKNPWINVHPWDHRTKEISIINQVHDYLPDKLNSLTFKPSLIHRIDRDTSWILLIAKKKDILTKLWEDFKKSEKWKINKTYIAYVFWRLSNKTWTIKDKLLRIEDAKSENKVQVSTKWQEAITHYKVIWEYTLKTKEGDLVISEVEVNIETWRMHQIRVHLSHIWNPVIMDDKYWNKKLNSYIEKNFWLKRQALHSSKIEFFHYWHNKKITLIANLKDDMKDFLEKIKK